MADETWAMKRIEVNNLWLAFNVRFFRREITIRRYLANWWGELRKSLSRDKRDGNGSSRFHALRAIEFTIEDGEVVGLVGHNGAGKSTLLMALAGIYRPNKGSVETHGSVGTLLSLGAGFDNELTGRENIRLYATLMGWDPRRDTGKVERIVEFADLGQFIDAPIRTYSSGMRARLGFALATQLDPDILLIDEVFEAGDAAFKARTLNLIDHYRNQGRTIVFATHSLPRVRRFCTRAILLDHGQIVADGKPDEIVDRYVSLVNDKLSAAENDGREAPQVEIALNAGAELAEGPFWDSRLQRLWWVDILNKKICQFDPVTGENRHRQIDQYIGTVVPRRGSEAIVALHHGLAFFDFESGKLTPICDPEQDKPRNRFNDGKCDPMGRFWAGTMSLDGEANAGSVYCLDSTLKCEHKFGDVTISNGLVWSLEQTQMFYIDTPTQEVLSFDFDRITGELTRKRPVIRVPREMGAPDGMTIDSAGMLWIALWGGGMVSRWDPKNGQLLQTIRVPASHVSACAFGGPDLETLYITTARAELSDEDLAEQPHAGAIFQVRPGVRGVELPGFAG